MSNKLRRLLQRNLNRLRRPKGVKLSLKPIIFEGPCPCCGGMEFKQIDVLWDYLVDIWDLANYEIDYINRQQGFRCQGCGCDLRSMALAAWLLRYMKNNDTLNLLVQNIPTVESISLLEINEAGGLTKFLKKLPKYKLATYPDVDMQNMHYTDDCFDIVIHSDTLEHVPDPVLALSECRRVLRVGGACVFTVPLVIDRLTRSTKGCTPSYHGHAYKTTEDFRVQTEFGADTWRYVIGAGFHEYQLFSFEYPSALVHIGIK